MDAERMALIKTVSEKIPFLTKDELQMLTVSQLRMLSSAHELFVERVKEIVDSYDGIFRFDKSQPLGLPHYKTGAI